MVEERGEIGIAVFNPGMAALPTYGGRLFEAPPAHAGK